MTIIGDGKNSLIRLQRPCKQNLLSDVKFTGQEVNASYRAYGPSNWYVRKKLVSADKNISEVWGCGIEFF